MSEGRDDAVSWARETAQEIRSNSGNLARQLAGAEFLRLHAGDESRLYKMATMYGTHDTSTNDEVADALDGWADLAEAGLAVTSPGLASHVEAATDLMEQVQALLDDQDVHPAAPVMLAGAALEEYLRGLVVAEGVAVTGKPGLTVYGNALRSAGVISQQDAKDVIVIAGVRNAAAHGKFDDVSRERAVLTADQVNLFLRQMPGT